MSINAPIVSELGKGNPDYAQIVRLQELVLTSNYPTDGTYSSKNGLLISLKLNRQNCNYVSSCR